jgi:predicted tellurium resistance membrane protein TerC
MYRELRHDPPGDAPGVDLPRAAKSFAGAAWAVAIADVSMSLDNVLAVAGAAREHPWVLVFGLVLAVGLMGIAANVLAKYIDRYRWIGWVGLAVILFVAGRMVYDGLTHHELGVLRYL